MRGQRQMSLDSCNALAQIRQIAVNTVETTVHLRKAVAEFRPDVGHVASNFGPDVGHVASLLSLSLK